MGAARAGARSPHGLEARGLAVVWSAGPGEDAILDAIDPRRRGARIAGTLSLAQLWHVLARARLLVCPDTGIAHLGRVVGVPTVTLFGPGSAVICGPGAFFARMPDRAVTVDPFPCRDQTMQFFRDVPWARRCERLFGDAAGALRARALHGGDRRRAVTAAIERWASSPAGQLDGGATAARRRSAGGVARISVGGDARRLPARRSAVANWIRCSGVGAVRASSSACVPISTMRPPSSTTMRSASSMVDSRCAMTIVVRPRISVSSAACTWRSDSESSARRRLVEDQDRRVLEDRARDRDALALAAGQPHAVLADDRVEAFAASRG